MSKSWNRELLESIKLIENVTCIHFCNLIKFSLIHSLAQSVRLIMALAIFLSYGLQFYVPMNIMGPWFRSLFTSEYAQNISDSGLRIALIIFTCKLIQNHSSVSNQMSIPKLICSFFHPGSYLGSIGTQFRTNYFAGWSIEFINACVDIPTFNWNRNIWSGATRSILLEAMERFGNYDLWNPRLFLWLIRKYYGTVESNTASNNVNSFQNEMSKFGIFAGHNGKFSTQNIVERECRKVKHQRTHKRILWPAKHISENKWLQ